MTTERLIKYGKEESREHGVSQKMGERLAKQHINRFGPDFYPAMEKLEQKFLKKKNRKKKRT